MIDKHPVAACVISVVVLLLYGCGNEARAPYASICSTYIGKPGKGFVLMAMDTDPVSGVGKALVTVSTSALFLSHGSQQIDIRTYIVTGTIRNGRMIAEAVQGPVQERDSDESIFGSDHVARDNFYFDDRMNIHRIETKGEDSWLYDLSVKNHTPVWSRKKSIPLRWQPEHYAGVRDWSFPSKTSADDYMSIESIFVIKDAHYLPRSEMLRPLTDD